MKPIHIALAVGLMIVWGLNFVFIRVALDSYPPLLLATLRFAIAGVPVLFVRRPPVALWRMLAIAMTLFVAQMAFLFTGMQVGFPPGLASLTLQVQAFFTVLIAAGTLGERPRPRNLMALAIAFAGLVVIAATVGSDGVTVTGFALILASALGWASGNVILRATPRVEMFGMMSWVSMLAVPPLLVLSLAIEGPAADWAALLHPSLGGLVGLAYVGIPTTIVGYWVWAELLKRYPAAMVAPFSLLAPVTGTIGSWLWFHESFSPMRLIGMTLILTGLVVNTLPFERWLARRVARA